MTAITKEMTAEMQRNAMNLETKEDALNLAKQLQLVNRDLKVKINQLKNFLNLSVLSDELSEFDTKQNAQLQDRLGNIQKLTDIISICMQKSKGHMNFLSYECPKHDYNADDKLASEMEKQGIEKSYDSCKNCGCAVGFSDGIDDNICQPCYDDWFNSEMEINKENAD